jgi:CDP-4-dehydro-6-deoxyglucose reductase
MFKIRLANKKEFHCLENKTILESARHAGLVLEHSCSSGQCGVCACELIRGEVNSLNDIFHSNEEIQANKILTCQSVPLADIEIDIEDLGDYAKYPSKTLPVRVSSIERIAKDILKVTFRCPPANKLHFLPGQYVELIHENHRRSYSLANAESKDGSFSLIIKKVLNGKMSDLLFNRTKDNDLFRIEGPLGTFGWRESIKENIIFLVTGTGIAPAISMLSQLPSEQLRVSVIWGNRYEAEFLKLIFLQLLVSQKYYLERIRLVFVMGMFKTCS